MIQAINGNDPHPDYGSWENFLTQCELRDEADANKKLEEVRNV